MSATTRSWAPAVSSSRAMAEPAAPAPDRTIRTSGSDLPTTRSALVRAARTTMAVPCWSSWKTGMSSSSRRRASTSKQRGAAMSSRLMPPKTGAMSWTVRTISSTSWVSSAIGQASMSANRLNSAALPSMTGSDAAGPMLPRPEHRRAVGHDGHGVALHGQPPDVVGLRGDGHAHAGDAGRVGHRQVVARAQRDLRAHLDLAAEVEQEGPVADLADRDALDLAQRLGEAAGVLLVARGAGDVDDDPVGVRLGDVERGDRAAGQADGGRQPADRRRVGRDLEPDGDRVRRAGDGHARIVPLRPGDLRRGSAGRVGGRCWAVCCRRWC